MSQSEAGPSVPAAADSQAGRKVKGQRSNRAQHEQKASDNRAKAQQNRERAAQNRSQKGQDEKIADQKAKTSNAASQLKLQDGAPKPVPAAVAGVKQPKNQQQKKDTTKHQASRPGKASIHFKSKVVIRRLPPNLPEEVFWKVVSPWVRDAADCQVLNNTASTRQESQAGASSSNATSATSIPTVDHKKFVVGKMKTDTNKQNKHARAYVRFLDPNFLVAFHKAFDGHIFRDSKGKESVAIVEFAPYQKVIVAPSNIGGSRGRRVRPDPKQGTIEKDAVYLAFVEQLNSVGDDVKRSEGDLLASLWDPKDKEREREAAVEKGKSTPLLEHLRSLKMAKKESAAATKKAKKMEKRMEKAEAFAAAMNAELSGAIPPGTALEVYDKEKAKNKKNKKGKEKETGKAIEVGGGGGMGGEPVKDKVRRDKKKKGKDKAADAAGGAAIGSVAISSLPDGAQQAQVAAPKQLPPKGPGKKKPDASKPQGGVDATNKPANGPATGEGKGKGKGKGKDQTPRRKGPFKEKSSSTSSNPVPASQAGKIQILKRDT
ncbi:uncharacterized protein MEPE_00249 [Melanopsichium pennsylvanicum]|uniref:UPF3 domain-containing protein n=2 Tax=Melanopsichium pennsylvanicum TaxID=63383 RepID=A0AAJ4XFQ2_9BASI|nr:uncharacterized protein BN887_02051 [Melanopsichium pennsylvanicum 4]SNX81544.1 uncharacterized protein MEPE_00249 [Melanopsichium pennsylvanicum]